MANFARMGVTGADLADGGSDRLADALVPHGSPAAVADAVRACLASGADHVCVQVLVPEGGDRRMLY